MKQVAEGRFLNEEAFLKFAEEHGQKHGAFIDTRGNLITSTWYADELVEAALAAGVPRLSHEELCKKYGSRA